MKHLKVKSIIISLLVLAGLTGAGQVGAATYLLEGVKCAESNVAADGYQVAPDCSPCDLIRVGVNASNMIMSFSGAIAFLMFILAGVMMIASYVNPKWVEQAKTIMKTTVIGLVLIFGAYTIVNVVIMTLYGGTEDSGAFQSAYKQITGKSDWGVCVDSSASN